MLTDIILLITFIRQVRIVLIRFSLPGGIVGFGLSNICYAFWLFGRLMPLLHRITLVTLGLNLLLFLWLFELDRLFNHQHIWFLRRVLNVVEIDVHFILWMI